MSEETKPETEDLATLIREDERRRTTACNAEIEVALKRHRCTIVPAIMIVGSQIDPSQTGVRVVALKS